MKKYIKQLNEDGVTLIETLIVMGLLSIMLVVLATIFTSAADVQQQSKSYSSTITSGRFIIARLNYDIAHASTITAPSAPGTTSPTLGLTISGTAYTYTLSGNNLQLTDGSGSDNLNSDDVIVSSPSFQELSNGNRKPTILYSFTISSVAKSHGSSNTQTFTSSAGLR
jgi:type II secretory pathway pseudopilin PulG